MKEQPFSFRMICFELYWDTTNCLLSSRLKTIQ